MHTQQTLLVLIQQLEALTRVMDESPYISREGRLVIIKEIDSLSHQLKEGEATYLQGEKSVIQLHKRVAIDEITTLSSKLRLLNPSSPRLENLRTLGSELQADAISPEQARQKIQALMNV